MTQPMSCQALVRNESWWQLRHQQKLEELQRCGYQTDIVLLGDSITHEWEMTGALAWQHYFADKSVLNLGFAGDCTEHVLWRIQNGEIDQLHARTVVLLVGTNNAGHRNEAPSDIAAGIECIIRTLQKKMPQATIVLMAIFVRSRHPKKKMRIAVDHTNALIKPLANGTTVMWLDLNDEFVDAQGILHESVMPDLLHPNAKQYEVWARALIDIL